ncbi:MAG: hypothetical protein ACR2HG_14140 [Pyrinomonadaceae bacterium]
MWNKIYLIVLAAAVLIISVLTYLSYSWLTSIGSPLIAVDNYNHYSNLGWIFLWISAVILLVVGNVVLWTTRKPWALWTSLLYFAVFIVLQTFWLEESFFDFKQHNNLANGAFSLSPFLGVGLIVLAAIIVFFNQFLVKRLHEKMYPPAQPIEPLPEESPINKNLG